MRPFCSRSVSLSRTESSERTLVAHCKSTNRKEEEER
jgi:hypothetical protein